MTLPEGAVTLTAVATVKGTPRRVAAVTVDLRRSRCQAPQRTRLGDDNDADDQAAGFGRTAVTQASENGQTVAFVAPSGASVASQTTGQDLVIRCPAQGDQTSPRSSPTPAARVDKR